MDATFLKEQIHNAANAVLEQLLDSASLREKQLDEKALQWAMDETSRQLAHLPSFPNPFGLDIRQLVKDEIFVVFEPYITKLTARRFAELEVAMKGVGDAFEPRNTPAIAESPKPAPAKRAPAAKRRAAAKPAKKKPRGRR